MNLTLVARPPVAMDATLTSSACILTALNMLTSSNALCADDELILFVPIRTLNLRLSPDGSSNLRPAACQR